MWQAALGQVGPPTVFVGHSMGGAIATWAANRQVSPCIMFAPSHSSSSARTAVTQWHCKARARPPARARHFHTASVQALPQHAVHTVG